MTSQNEQPKIEKGFDPFDGLWDESVETKEEFINRSRGTYSALHGETDKTSVFAKFINYDTDSYPDIDGSFVDGDRVRAETMDFLKEKYLNPAQSATESPALDGYSDTEEIIQKAREAGSNDPLRNAEWFKIS